MAWDDYYTRDETSSPRACWHCGAYDHFKADCPELDSDVDSDLSLDSDVDSEMSEPPQFEERPDEPEEIDYTLLCEYEWVWDDECSDYDSEDDYEEDGEGGWRKKENLPPRSGKLYKSESYCDGDEPGVEEDKYGRGYADPNVVVYPYKEMVLESNDYYHTITARDGKKITHGDLVSQYNRMTRNGQTHPHLIPEHHHFLESIDKFGGDGERMPSGYYCCGFGS